MARKHSKSAKKRTHRQRKHRQRAGGWGFTGNASIPGTPGTVSNPMVYTGIGDCRATEPGYTIPVSQYGAFMKGLPGMAGGGKKTRKGRKGKTRKHRQKGGRYGFFPEGDVNPSGQAWWAGSYAPIQRIACEGTTQNPLNPTHTPSSAPPGAASGNYFYNPLKGLMSGGGQRGGSQVTTGQRGGAQQMAPATYGVGNVDSMYHYSPTAGYANTASTWLDSVGAPVQIQVPFAARSMNQACLSTGGHPPLTGALQKGGKRSRKQKQHRGGSQVTTGHRGGSQVTTGQRGGSIWNMPGQIIGNLFGNRGSANVVDVSGANVSIPPGAPVGIPNTTESNLNRARRNNTTTTFPSSQPPQTTNTVGAGSGAEQMTNTVGAGSGAAFGPTPLSISIPRTTTSTSSGSDSESPEYVRISPLPDDTPDAFHGGRGRKHKKSKSRKHRKGKHSRKH